MILNFSHRFAFVHIPKTAGTALCFELSKLTKLGDVELGGTVFGEALAPIYRQRFGLHKHSTAIEIRKVAGEDSWRALFKFACVRNPYSRAFSTYRFLQRRFRRWKGSEIMDGLPSFDAYVASEFFQTDGPDRIHRPQIFWLRNSAEDATPIVDFLMRVESLDADWAHLVERLSPKVALEAKLARRNESGDANEWLAAYATDATRLRVFDRYRQDFASFGYSEDP